MSQDINVDDIVKKMINGGHIDDSDIQLITSSTKATMNPDLYGSLQKYLIDNFTNTEKFTTKDFTFIQELIDRIDNKILVKGSSISKNLQNAIRHCFKYKERPEFIPLLRPSTTAMMATFSCLNEKTISLPIAVLDSLNAEQLDSLNPSIPWSEPQLEAIERSRSRLGPSSVSVTKTTNTVVRNKQGDEITSIRSSDFTTATNNNASASKNLSASTRNNNLANSSRLNTETGSTIRTANFNQLNSTELKTMSDINSASLLSSKSKNASPLKSLNSRAASEISKPSSINKNLAALTSLTALSVAANSTGTESEFRTAEQGNTLSDKDSLLSTEMDVQAGPKKAVSNVNSVSDKNSLLSTEVRASPKRPTKMNQNAFTEANDKDVNDIVSNIQTHLQNFDKKIDISDVPSVNQDIYFGDNKITIACLIKFISGKTIYPNANGCDSFFAQIVDNKGNVDMDRLIAIDKNDDITKSMNKYQSFYKIVMGYGNFIAKSSEFKSAPQNVKNNIFDSFKVLIRAAMKYGFNMMESFKIINDDLIRTNSNLIYLYTITTIRQVNQGVDLQQLITLYNEVIDAVNRNLDIFRKMGDEAFAKESFVSYGSNEEVTKLVSQLQNRLSILEEQRKQLESNIVTLQQNLVIGTPDSNVNDIAKYITNEQLAIENK